MSENKKPAKQSCDLLKKAVTITKEDVAEVMKWPTLIDVLMPRYDGEYLVREAAIITLTVSGATFLVKVKCPTECKECQIELDGLDDLLDRVEEALKRSVGRWRATWRGQKKA